LFLESPIRRLNLTSVAKPDELLPVDGDSCFELPQLDEQEPEMTERHRDEELRKTGT
jgi:hypothetical protein